MSNIAKMLAVGLILAAAGVTATAATGGEHGKSQGSGFWSWGGGGHGKGQRGIMRLKRLDADKDGSVTRDEFLAGPRAAFAGLDKDRNGAIEPAELRAPMDERSDIRTRRFVKRLDANGDGKISKDEFTAGPKARFAERDLNNDGKITDDERPGRKGRLWSWGKGSDAKKERTLEGVLEKAEARFKELDADGNGTIEPAELTAAEGRRADERVRRTMHRFDKNGDGRITADEFLAKPEKRFSSLDLNNDGRIGPQDLSPAEQRAWGGKE